MDLNNLFETISFDFVLEGIGILFAFSLLWHFLFLPELHDLLSYLITTLC